MSYLLPLVLTLTNPAINIDAGYYSLNELSRLTAKQGVNIKVQPSIGNDVYLLRLADVEPTALVHALAATGRLIVEAHPDGWFVGRDLDHKKTQTAALKLYTRILGNTSRALVGVAENNWKRVMGSIKRGKWDSELKALIDPPASDVLTARANQISYDWLTCKLETHVLGGAVSPNAPYFDYGPVWEYVHMYKNGRFHAGEEGAVLPYRTPLFGLSEEAYVSLPGFTNHKLTFDPVSGTLGSRIVCWSDDLKKTWSQKVTILPPGWPTPGPEAILGAAASAYRARISATTDVLKPKQFEAEATLPGRPLRFSEELLRIADKTEQNVIAYVGPFGDRTLQNSPRQSMRGLIASANKERFDQASETVALRERVMPDLKPSPGTPFPAFSAVAQDGILVVRDERDYLDDLLSGPYGIPNNLENDALRNNLPHVADIAKCIDALSPTSPWGTYVFSTRYLTYCNPFSFYPFAHLFMNSRSFNTFVSSLGEGQSASMRVSDIDPANRYALHVALDFMRGRNDALQSLNTDPLLISFSANVKSVEGSQILVRRSKDRYDFSIQMGMDTLWNSWINNVRQ